MGLLIVQLSDIHFRAKSNPVSDRLDPLLAAIASILPRPAHCLLLLTGDIAWAGSNEEYRNALAFCRSLRSGLERLFDAVSVTAIPGNHDCLLPEEQERLRAALIAGVLPTLQSLTPDPAILARLLEAQEGFFSFVSEFTGYQMTGSEQICRVDRFNVGAKSVRVLAFNTALLTQRREKPGVLEVPMAIIERVVPSGSEADINISVYHHPDNWLEPNTRRSFRKFIESSSNLVFTGHEHQQDNHVVESSSGDSLMYVEADALQDAAQPQLSGFNCLKLDPDGNSCEYSHFRWKDGRYSALVEGAQKVLLLGGRAHPVFTPNARFRDYLIEDDFGFNNLAKGSKLLLKDFFVYPTLEARPSKPQSPSKRIKSDDVFRYLLSERQLLLRAQDRAGRTALLKTIYSDLLAETQVIPVLLTDADITSSSEEEFFLKIWSAVRAQYSGDLVESYKQLPPERRGLLIDDWHKTRLKPDAKRKLIQAAKAAFGLLFIASNESMELNDVFSMAEGDFVTPTIPTARVSEFSASARGALIDKWVRIGTDDAGEEEEIAKRVEKEQGIIDYLIGKKALPSLPYIILGVLQARQDNARELSDPGSVGYLVQKLVLDALSVSRKGRRKLMDRKDVILRFCAYELFQANIDVLSVSEFKEIVRRYSQSKKVDVDEEEILDDLLYGRVLLEDDGNLRFKYEYFYYYFLARHFIDEIEGPKAVAIRGYLDAMADRPLTKSNQLTLIFFLFFKKRDAVIDRIIQQSRATFPDEVVSDLVSDTAFIDSTVASLSAASVDTAVDPGVERQRRLEKQDSLELEAASGQQRSLDLQYDDELEFKYRADFAMARLELLGQVIRSFPDSLDGEKKVEILEAAFSLGLRHLHACLGLLKTWYDDGIGRIDAHQGSSKEDKEKARRLLKQVVGIFVRGTCDAVLLNISRAVGVSDLEKAYSEAIERVGSTPATKLIGLAITLDHSDGFPFREVSAALNSLPDGCQVAVAVVSDLVVRHTQIFKLKTETLRKVAGLIRVPAIALRDVEGRNRKPQG